MAKLFLFLLPAAILGVTPRLWFISFIITISYCIIAVASASARHADRSISRETWQYVFITVIFLSVSMSFSPPLNDYGIQKGLYFIFIIMPLSIAAAFILRDIGDLRYILWGFVILGLAVALLSLFSGRSILGAERYLWTGNLCAISAVILLDFRLVKNKLLSLALVSVDIFGIAVSAAKQSVAVLLVGLLLIIIFNFFDFKNKFKDLAALAVFIVFTLVLWEGIKNLSVFSSIVTRFDYYFNLSENPILGERAVFYKLAWQEFLRNPVFGTGIGGFAEKYGNNYHFYPHNIFLEILCEFGVTGAVVFFVPLLFAGVLMVRKWLISKEQALIHLLLLFISFLVIGNFSGDFVSNRGVWIFGVLIINLALLNSPGPVPSFRKSALEQAPKADLPAGTSNMF